MKNPKYDSEKLKANSARKVRQIYRLLAILVVVMISFYVMNRLDLSNSSVNQFLKVEWSCVNKPVEVRYWSFSREQARTEFLSQGKIDSSTAVDNDQPLTGNQFFKIRCFEGSTFTGKTIQNPWIVLRVKTPDETEIWWQTTLKVDQELLDQKEILLDCPGEPFTNKQQEWTRISEKQVHSR